MKTPLRRTYVLLILFSMLVSACASAPADQSDRLRLQKIERLIDRVGR